MFTCFNKKHPSLSQNYCAKIQIRKVKASNFRSDEFMSQETETRRTFLHAEPN